MKRPSKTLSEMECRGAMVTKCILDAFDAAQVLDYIAHLEAKIAELRETAQVAQSYAAKKDEMMRALEDKYFALLAQKDS